MKIKEKNASKPVVVQPVFHKVAENLYRLESSGGYYALLKRGGKQFRRSLKTKDRKLADRRLSDFRARIGCLQISPEARLNFGQTAKLWLAAIQHALSASTVKRKEMYINGLLPHFKGIAVRNVAQQDCERWVSERGSKLAPETFVHELDVLKSVLDFALKRGLILTNPAADIKRRRIVSKSIVVPTLDQFRQLIAAIRRSDGRRDSQVRAKAGADLVELLAFSGARVGEVTGGGDAHERRPLRWTDVHFDRGTIFLPGTKSESAPRTIPMSDKLRELLLRLKQSDPQPSDAIVSIKSARKCLQTACTKLGFPKFTHHDFRHFFATTCIESGVDIPTVSRWLGHKDGGALAMKRYGHLRQEHSLAMIKRVNFDQPTNMMQRSEVKSKLTPPELRVERRAIAKVKAKYKYPWWASEDPLEILWGQLHEQTLVVPEEKLLGAARRAMNREVFVSELADRESLLDELSERISLARLERLVLRIQQRSRTRAEGAAKWSLPKSGQ